MRLDHVSYAASHEQIVDVIQRFGSQIGCTFTDGGIHPRFGTRNFTLALKDGHYLEVVCPIEHPASDSSPFGRVVSKRAREGGGWLTWVISTEDLSPIERRLGRQAVYGSRKRPDGSELQWKQLGVLGTLSDAQLPFFIQWMTPIHPSTDGKAVAEISMIEIAGKEEIVKEWLGCELSKALDGIAIEWVEPSKNDGQMGIVAVHLRTPNGVVRLE
jgi:Glyoxalase-like domain